FYPSPDGTRCEEYESFAVVATTKYIRGFHINSSDHSEAMVPIAIYSTKNKLDLHIESGFVYWSEDSSYSSYRGIFRAKTDGGSFSRVISSGVGSRGIQGNIYFTNAFEKQTFLEVLTINTTYRMVLLKSFEDQPRDLAVSPKLRYLFWTDGGQSPKIERALLDGTNRTVLASESLASPRGIIVDYTSNFLYWTDDVLDMISRMAIDGTQRQIIRYGSRYPSPTGLAIFGNYMLWVDKKLEKLFQSSKDPANTDQPEVIRDSLDGGMDVAVFDSHVQPTSANLVGFNPCHDNNGRCQQLCFAIPDQERPKCGCAHGSLLSNGVSCGYGLDDFIVFTTDYTVNSLRLDPTDHSVPYPKGVKYPFSVTVFQQDIFWTDWAERGVFRAGKDDGSGFAVIAQDLQYRPNDIHVYSGSKQEVCSSFCQQFNGGCSHICFSAFHTCSSLDFTCDNGRCVFMSYVCDYTNDCVDNSDERGCAFPTCNPATEFTCSNGRCINSDYVCDGRNDCRDNNTSDEIGCRDSSQFTCPTWYPGHPRCVPLNSVCDGEKDCANAADELQNCPNRTCHLNEFACANGLCILIPYHSSQFTCSNGACIPPSYTCDGDNDCLDGSDEADSLCVTPQPTCSPQQYMCNSGECIDLQKVCNGQKDCQDNSDEKGCGYRLMPDGKACEDLNECTSTPAVCSQICENSVGSFHCKCAPGYIREPDGRTCRQNSGIPSYLLYTNRYYIRYLYVDGSESGIAQQGLSNVVAVDYDDYEKWIYWLDVGAGKIERKRFDGSNRQTLVDHNIRGVEGLVVDWVGRKLYWVDSYYSSIHVMELDGRYQKKLVTGQFRNGNDTYFISRPRADGNCTFPGFLCNGHPQCPDGSDEDAALCMNDCPDGSDEDADTCAQRTCRPGEFKCANGRCVPSSYVCDAQDDCGDGSDEPYETCMGPDYKCDEDTEFSCKTNYRCIPQWARCDGTNDCIDNSDEEGCGQFLSV
ncbi:hypothetical protein XENOCAPTIV_018968, partial [Xenoophorus captivus]